jgi:putative membrane protein
MFIETLLYAFAGCGLGIFAGLMPGMHVNTLIAVLLPFASLFSSPYCFVVFIVAVGVSEIFINFIPSIFLGAPEADTAMSVLPGHRLLMEGCGYEALKLIVVGGLGALFFSILLVALFAGVFSSLYEISRPYMHFVISAAVCLMILSEKKLKKIAAAALIIFMTGFLGILVLNSPLLPKQHVLFPVFSGMFGVSTLFISIAQKAKIPEQGNDSVLKISNKEIAKSIALGSLAGIVVGLLPAIGISEAAAVVQYVGGSPEARSFLVTLSGINIGNELFSLISLYLVGNPRSGTSVAIQQIMTELTFFDVVYLTGVIFLSAGVGALLTLYLGKKIPNILAKLNYRNLCLSVIIFINAMIFIFTGFMGLLVSFTSTAIGLLCAYLEVRRSHCMGILLINTILFFSGLNPFIISILRI